METIFGGAFEAHSVSALMFSAMTLMSLADAAVVSSSPANGGLPGCKWESLTATFD